jgi:hypothetical protein
MALPCIAPGEIPALIGTSKSLGDIHFSFAERIPTVPVV